MANLKIKESGRNWWNRKSRRDIYINGNTSFKYLPSEMGDNEKILGMFVTIMDNSGAELPGSAGNC